MPHGATGIAKPTHQGYTRHRVVTLLGVSQGRVERWQADGRVTFIRKGATLCRQTLLDDLGDGLLRLSRRSRPLALLACRDDH